MLDEADANGHPAAWYFYMNRSDIEVLLQAAEGIGRMVAALEMIGYSSHSGTPRLGPKAQTARWGLGKDALPTEGGKKQ